MRPFKFLLAVFLLLSGAAALAQPYTVLRIVGKVESNLLKRVLQPGDRIDAKDKFTFGSRSAHVFLTSVKTGHVRIAGVPDSSPHEIMQLMEMFMRPDKKSSGSRGFSEEYTRHLENTMSYDTLLIIGDGRVPVDQSKLSLAAPAAVKALHWSGKNVVYNKVSATDGIILTEKSLFGGLAPAPLPKVQIMYYENENDDPMFSNSIPMGTFVPLFVGDKELLLEIKALTGFVKSEMIEANLLDEIKKFLEAEYAMPQADNLNLWLVKNGIMR